MQHLILISPDILSAHTVEVAQASAADSAITPQTLCMISAQPSTEVVATR